MPALAAAKMPQAGITTQPGRLHLVGQVGGSAGPWRVENFCFIEDEVYKMVRRGEAIVDPLLGGVIEALDDFDADFEKRREGGIGSPQSQGIQGRWRRGRPILRRNPQTQDWEVADPLSKRGHTGLPSCMVCV